MKVESKKYRTLGVLGFPDATESNAEPMVVTLAANVAQGPYPEQRIWLGIQRRAAVQDAHRVACMTVDQARELIGELTAAILDVEQAKS